MSMAARRLFQFLAILLLATPQVAKSQVVVPTEAGRIRLGTISQALEITQILP